MALRLPHGSPLLQVPGRATVGRRREELVVAVAHWVCWQAIRRRQTHRHATHAVGAGAQASRASVRRSEAGGAAIAAGGQPGAAIGLPRRRGRGGDGMDVELEVQMDMAMGVL